VLGLSSSAFDIDLDARQVVDVLRDAEIGCAGGNALMKFDTDNERRIKRQKGNEENGGQYVAPAVTSNGLVFAGGQTPTPVPFASVTLSASSSSRTASAPTDTSTSNSEGGSSSNSDEDRDVEFARVAVLWTLQTSKSVDVAEKAREALVAYLKQNGGGKDDTKTLQLGSGYSCDFADRTVENGDGAKAGGRENGSS
jgi:hypothetical protein